MAQHRQRLLGLARSDRGAIAPSVALSLVALIAAGGVAFDYARLASLDTELQNAADHAALAGATQLDGAADACARADTAARALIANDTRFATDDGTQLVAIKPGADGVVCDGDSVRVNVVARTVDYALTPIVGAMSGTTAASARAALGSAVCKVPPLMMCNPAEAAGSLAFDVDAYVGKGIRAKSGGGGAWVPGNFGFLEVGASPSANNLREIFGKVSTDFLCVSENGVTTAPGNMSAVATAINTRFDIYENGWASSQCNPTACPSAMNTSKDVVRGGGNCNLSNNGWRLVPQAERYEPNPATRIDTNVTSMGHPRDICHAVSENGDCPGAAANPVGDGNWDRAKYMAVNHPGVGIGAVTRIAAIAAHAPQVTRYETYMWEIASGSLGNRAVGSWMSHKAPICSPGLAVSPTTADRRKASMAVINCQAEGVNGHSTDVEVVTWLDIFLVEPSLARTHTDTDEIYIEVVGETETAGNGSQGQLIRRDVPYLIE